MHGRAAPPGPPQAHRGSRVSNLADGAGQGVGAHARLRQGSVAAAGGAIGAAPSLSHMQCQRPAGGARRGAGCPPTFCAASRTPTSVKRRPLGITNAPALFLVDSCWRPRAAGIV